jgi:hypothetical protein
MREIDRIAREESKDNSGLFMANEQALLIKPDLSPQPQAAAAAVLPSVPTTAETGLNRSAAQSSQNNDLNAELVHAREIAAELVAHHEQLGFLQGARTPDKNAVAKVTADIRAIEEREKDFIALHPEFFTNIAPIKEERQAAAQAERARLEIVARDFNYYTRGMWNSESKIQTIIEGYSSQQLQRIDQIFKEEFGTSMLARLEQRKASSDIRSELEAGLRGDRGAIAAHQLFRAMNRWRGDDESAIHQALRGLSSSELAQTNQIFNSRFASRLGYRDLQSTIKGRIGGDDQILTLALLNSQQSLADASTIHQAAAGWSKDTGAIHTVLENRTPAEIKAIEATFKDTYNETLESYFNRRLSSSDAARANLIRVGDKVEKFLVTVNREANAWYQADAHAIRSEWEKLSVTEQQQARERYYERNGRSLSDNIQSLRLSAVEKRTLNALIRKGALSDVDLFIDATEGWGTKEDQLRALFVGKTKAQIDELAKQYHKETGGDLKSRALSETSGELRFDIEMMLEGIPETVEQVLSQTHRRFQYERSGYFVKAIDFFSSRDEEMKADFREIERIAKLMEDPAQRTNPELQAELIKHATRFTTSSDAFRESKNIVADTAASVAGGAAVIVIVAGATVITIVSGGAGAPLLVVAGAAAAASLTARAATKTLLKGDSYSSGEFAQDGVYAAIDGGTILAAGVGGRLALSTAQATGGQAVLTQAIGRPAAVAVIEGAGAAASSAGAAASATTAVQAETWEHGIVEGATQVLESGATAALVAAPTGAAMGLLAAKTPLPSKTETRVLVPAIPKNELPEGLASAALTYTQPIANHGVASFAPLFSLNALPANALVQKNEDDSLANIPLQARERETQQYAPQPGGPRAKQIKEQSRKERPDEELDSVQEPLRSKNVSSASSTSSPQELVPTARKGTVTPTSSAIIPQEQSGDNKFVTKVEESKPDTISLGKTKTPELMSLKPSKIEGLQQKMVTKARVNEPKTQSLNKPKSTHASNFDSLMVEEHRPKNQVSEEPIRMGPKLVSVNQLLVKAADQKITLDESNRPRRDRNHPGARAKLPKRRTPHKKEDELLESDTTLAETSASYDLSPQSPEKASTPSVLAVRRDLSLKDNSPDTRERLIPSITRTAQAVAEEIEEKQSQGLVSIGLDALDDVTVVAATEITARHDTSQPETQKVDQVELEVGSTLDEVAPPIMEAAATQNVPFSQEVIIKELSHAPRAVEKPAVQEIMATIPEGITSRRDVAITADEIRDSVDHSEWSQTTVAALPATELAIEVSPNSDALNHQSQQEIVIEPQSEGEITPVFQAETVVVSAARTILAGKDDAEISSAMAPQSLSLEHAIVEAENKSEAVHASAESITQRETSSIKEGHALEVLLAPGLLANKIDSTIAGASETEEVAENVARVSETQIVQDVSEKRSSVIALTEPDYILEGNIVEGQATARVESSAEESSDNVNDITLIRGAEDVLETKSNVPMQTESNQILQEQTTESSESNIEERENIVYAERAVTSSDQLSLSEFTFYNLAEIRTDETIPHAVTSTEISEVESFAQSIRGFVSDDAILSPETEVMTHGIESSKEVKDVSATVAAQSEIAAIETDVTLQTESSDLPEVEQEMYTAFESMSDSSQPPVEIRAQVPIISMQTSSLEITDVFQSLIETSQIELVQPLSSVKEELATTEPIIASPESVASEVAVAVPSIEISSSEISVSVTIESPSSKPQDSQEELETSQLKEDSTVSRVEEMHRDTREVYVPQSFTILDSRYDDLPLTTTAAAEEIVREIVSSQQEAALRAYFVSEMIGLAPFEQRQLGNAPREFRDEEIGAEVNADSARQPGTIDRAQGALFISREELEANKNDIKLIEISALNNDHASAVSQRQQAIDPSIIRKFQALTELAALVKISDTRTAFERAQRRIRERLSLLAKEAERFDHRRARQHLKLLHLLHPPLARRDARVYQQRLANIREREGSFMLNRRARQLDRPIKVKV